MSGTLSVKKCDSLFDELKKVEERVMQRAYDLFKSGSGSNDLENWFAAERELVWKPSMELREKGNEFEIDIAVPGVDPKAIDIEVTPEELLVKAEMQHEHKEEKGKVHTCEFQSGNLFRAITFPKNIDTDKVKADFKNGMLKITAPISASKQSRKIDVQAA